MPVNGLVFAADQVHFSLHPAVTSGGTSTGAYHTCELFSFWTPDVIDVNTGISLKCYDDLTGAPIVTYIGPGSAPAGDTYSGTNADLYINDFKLYGVNPGGENYLWHIFASSITLYIDGTLTHTYAAFNVVSDGLGPSWVPVISGLNLISGGAALNAGDAQTGFGSVSGTVSGGWRLNIGGTWYAFPVVIPTVIEAGTTLYNPGAPPYLPPYSFPAPFGLSIGDVILSTSTYGPQLQNSITRLKDGFGVLVDDEEQGGWVLLVPNLPKSITRMNADFTAGFLRYPIPQVTGQAARNGSITYPSQEGNATTGGGVVVPRQAFGTEEVGPTPGALEAYFGLPTYAPFSTSHQKAISTRGSGGAYNTVHEALTHRFPYSVDALGTYMAHGDTNDTFNLGMLCRYFNSPVVHPHWSIGFNTDDQPLGGSPTPWAGYWGDIREQYLGTQKRRNAIVSDPLETSGWTPFLDAYFTTPSGKGMRWIGNCRWQTQDVTPPTSVTLDSGSAAAWSVESGCTLSHGSVITITPTSATCTFDLDLARFDVSPFFYAALCNQLTVNWPSTNITSVALYAVSEDGTTSELLTTSPGTVSIGRMQDAKYAGSWAIDNGNGVVTDTGIDVATGGISGTVMADDRRQVAFGFLTGGQPVKLRFVVTPVSTSSTCAINYPTLIAATIKIQIHENGQISNLLYKNGPGVRMGNHVWYDAGGFEDPPNSDGLGYKGTVIDWLCDRRVLLQNTSPTGGTPNLTTELTQLYDSFEGQSIGAVDADSLYFLLPQVGTEANVRAALVNTWSEVPPLVGFPTFDRNPDWSLNTSAMVQKVWTLCQKPRRIMTPGQRLDLLNPSGVLQTSAGAGIAGWTVTEASPIVDGTETVNWQLVTDAGSPAQKLWAKVMPWHGYFWSGNFASGEKQPYNWADHGCYHRATITAGGNIYYRSSPLLGLDWAVQVQVTNDGNWSWPRMARNFFGRLELRAIQTVSGTPTAYAFTSDDEGATWSYPTSILMGATLCDIASQDGELLQTCFVPDAGTTGPGTFSMQFRGPGDMSWSSAFVPKDSMAAALHSDGSGFKVVKGQATHAPWIITFIVAGETNASDWWCTDLSPTGATFTRF